MIDKTVEKIKGRPKIDWDFHYFDDVDLKKLDQLKNKQLKKIQSLNDKISKIDLLIKDVQKLISKHNASKKPIFKQLSIAEDNLNSISRAIEQKSKIYTKNDDCITLSVIKALLGAKYLTLAKSYGVTWAATKSMVLFTSVRRLEECRVQSSAMNLGIKLKQKLKHHG